MAYIIILIGALLRVLPHAANFAPIGAIALFGGVYLKPRLAIAVPLAAMIISDFFIGFDSLQTRLVVYGCFVMIASIGLLVRQKRKNVATVIGGSLAGSVLFYLVTNLVFLYPASMYTRDWSGQTASYTNALPFFRPTIVSDLMYTAIFFGSYELIQALAKRKSAYAKNY